MEPATTTPAPPPGRFARWLSPRPPGAPLPIAVGTMNFGGRTPKPEAERIVGRALDLGLDFFDTANAYGDGTSERITGDALKTHRDRVMLATKVGWRRVAGRYEGLSRAVIARAADESLARLSTDRIDVYYLHVPDRVASFDETLDALEGLFDVGKIRAWGISNYASWQILELTMLAAKRKMPPPVHSQVLYNLLIRQLDVEYFAFAAAHPIHTTIYNPLAGGLLAGGHTKQEASPPKGSRFDGNKMYQRRYWSKRFFDLCSAYADLAAKDGRTLIDLAYGFLAHHGSVDSVLVGPASVAHLDSAVAACARPISPELRAEIDDLHVASLGTDASYAR